jgi:serine/threonine protein kinase
MVASTRGEFVVSCVFLSSFFFLLCFFSVFFQVMLANSYSFALDVWSVGTIMAELLLRKPLFMGKDYADQLVRIIAILGTPSPNQIAAIPDAGARGKPPAAFLIFSPHFFFFLFLDFVKNLKKYPKLEWEMLLPNASSKQRAAVAAMLVFDPAERISLSDLLQMPVFAKRLKDFETEPGLPMQLSWTEREIETVEDIDRLLEAELKESEKVRNERLKE